MQNDSDHARLFEQAWDPQAYLEMYYPVNELTADEQAILEYLVTFFKTSDRHFNSAIEVGCGPTIHHTIPVVAHVAELHMADFVPSNLEAVQCWLNAEPSAHDWDWYVHRVLQMEMEASFIPHQTLVTRKQQIRKTITALKHVDLRQPHPLGKQQTYDLVLSFYCADSATSSKDEWRIFMHHLLTLLAPNGTLIVSALRHAKQYTVANQQFPSALVDEEDVAAVFTEAGFAQDNVHIQVVEVAAWRDFSSVIIARADRYQTLIR